MGDYVDQKPSEPITALEDTSAAATASNSTATPSSRSQPFLSLNGHNVFWLLVGFRLLNALTVQTFFQPDEYFQALEPAWHLAFGKDAGAWITWEWKRHLRSAIHPTIFAACYKAAQAVAEFFNLDTHARAELLLAAPKSLQAIFAALTDLYTWKLASYVYGANSGAALSTLLVTVTSPWQWFCSTRTFSNSLETTLTIVALYNWPWHWQLRLDKGERGDSDETDELTRLRRALLCAAVATVLRPTNILVWVILTLLTFMRGWKLSAVNWAECALFVRETALCGSVVLLLSGIIDRIFYDAWVFPPLNFLHVNVVQSLATFYGNNDWHYYISQGYPLLLTTALPFTLVGLYRSLSSRMASGELGPQGNTVLRSLSTISLAVPAIFSIIAHKEVRFIYPLLPALHIVTAQPWFSFFDRDRSKFAKKLLLGLIVVLNVSISFYTTQVHNSGLIRLTDYLRNEFETAHLRIGTGIGSGPRHGGQEGSITSNMTLGILMPCHSTPWRSHFQYPPTSTSPGIQAWALTCDPPVDLNLTERSNYLDEADQFYLNPGIWLKKNMVRNPPASQGKDTNHANSKGVFAQNHRHAWQTIRSHSGSGSFSSISRDVDFWTTGSGRRPWPDYLVFFAQLEPTLTLALRGSGYGECRRFFNSHWHDDWRRKGDVVVWCLDQERQQDEGSRGRAGAGAALGGSSSGTILDEKSDVEEKAFHDTDVKGWGREGRSEKVTEKEEKQSPKRPVTRVVEKPFWKVREPEVD